MFTYKKRNKAVKLLIKYDIGYSNFRRELGYPSKTTLQNWYKEYKKCGDLHSSYKREEKYSVKEKQDAVRAFDS